MFDFITATALVWTIYIFLFSEADKQLAELLRRIRFAISVNPTTGAIELEQLQAKQHLSPQDVHDFGKAINGAQHKAAIEIFTNKYRGIEIWRNILLVNISLLTLLVLILSFQKGACLQGWVRMHLIISLLLGGVFYYLVSKLPNQKFSQITRMPQ